MNRTRTCLAALIVLSFVLTGCPISSKYPLGVLSAAKPFDKTLIGTWKHPDEKAEATVITIEKGKNQYPYRVFVMEKGESFMADSEIFDAWIITLEGKNFLVLKETETEEAYFVYHIKVGVNEIITNDITLKVKGTDAITSVKSYQEEVIASMKKDGFLAGQITWKRK